MAHSSFDKSFYVPMHLQSGRTRFEESGFLWFARYSIIHVKLSVISNDVICFAQIHVSPGFGTKTW